MPSFAEVVSSVATQYTSPRDVEDALAVLGPDANAEFRGVPQRDRVRMVDRFVRNLHVGVRVMVDLQRELLRALDARPDSEFHTELTDARSVLAVRSQVKEVLTVLGHGWELLARTQAAVCGLVRWLQSTGGGTLNISLTRTEAHFQVSADALGADAQMIEASPIVRALRSEVSEFAVVERDRALFLDFFIKAT